MEALLSESAKTHNLRCKLFEEKRVKEDEEKIDKSTIFKNHLSPIPFEELLERKTLRYPEEYKIAVLKLKELRFDVIYVYEYKEKEGHYSDRIFDFFCVRGDWHFIAYYLEDFDCPGGIFGVKEVHHQDGTLVSQYCDLYCQNTNESRIDRFLNLLRSPDLETFYKGDFSEFKATFEALKGIYGKRVTNNIHQRDSYRFKPDICVEKVCSDISPYFGEDGEVHDDFNADIHVKKIYIQETGDLQFRMIERLPNEHDYCPFYYYGQNIRYNPDYHIKAYRFERDTDISVIQEMVRSFFREIEGDFGFLEGETLYNHENLEDWITTFQRTIVPETDWSKLKNNIEIFTEPMSIYFGNVINLKCVITFGDGYSCDLEQEIFLVDFKYNTSKDPERCYLEICKGVYNCETCDYDDVGGNLGASGSFTEMFGRLKWFVTKIYKIHDLEVSKEE